MSLPNGDHQLKRIVLPSGKTIEVVYFDHPSAAPPLTEERPAEQQRFETAPARDLHICSNCESELVYPLQWEEADERHWHITLRCPNCEWSDAGIYAQDECDRFDDELEQGTDALTRDYKRLVTANLADEIDRFAYALEVDGLLPEDF